MGQDEESSEEDFDDIEEGELEPSVTVEVSGLSLYTRHGVSEAERELGQRLVFDVTLRLPECDATVTDRVEDTADYAEVCEQVALAAQERSYRTLERLCTAVADRLLGPLRRRGGDGEGGQARAADRPAGRRGGRRGVEGGLVALRAGAGQRPSPPRHLVGDRLDRLEQVVELLLGLVERVADRVGLRGRRGRGAARARRSEPGPPARCPGRRLAPPSRAAGAAR